MRNLILSGVLCVSSLVILSGAAMAYPNNAEAPQPKSAADTSFELPSTAELEAAIDELPDLNAMLGDFLNLVKDERLQERMERSGEAFAEKMENSGALEPDENGIPDIKLTLKALVGALGDEEVTGGLLETLSEMQQLMEKYVPEEDETAKPE